MKKKTTAKETRGRKTKMHKPVDASFDEVLGTIGKSEYKDKKAIKTPKK